MSLIVLCLSLILHLDTIISSEMKEQKSNSKFDTNKIHSILNKIRTDVSREPKWDGNLFFL